MSREPDSLLLTAREVSALTRLSPKQVRRRGQSGDIPGMVRLFDSDDDGTRGSQIFFSRKLVWRWLSSRFESAGLEAPRFK